MLNNRLTNLIKRRKVFKVVSMAQWLGRVMLAPIR
jgi:hypothetical protein